MSEQIDYNNVQDLEAYTSGLRHLGDVPAWAQLMRGLQNEMRMVMEKMDRVNDPYEVMALKGQLSAYRAMVTWRERTVKTIDEIISNLKKSKEKQHAR